MPDPCAHIGFGFLAARLVGAVVPWQTPMPESLAIDLLIVAASNLPDAIDKPLFLARCAPGTRSFGHTLMFLAAASAAAAWLAAAKPMLIAAAFGASAAAIESPPASAAAAAAAVAPAAGFAAGVAAAFGSGLARVVFAAIASHLVADMLFGYVPLLWPLPGWEFRPTPMCSRDHREATKRRKSWLDLAAVTYVTLATAVPQHVGGWMCYAAAAAASVAALKVGVELVKRLVSRGHRKTPPPPPSADELRTAAGRTEGPAEQGKRGCWCGLGVEPPK
jgi:hypothetical protein